MTEFNPLTSVTLMCHCCGQQTVHAETLLAIPCAGHCSEPLHYLSDWTCTVCNLTANNHIMLPNRQDRGILITSDRPHEVTPVTEPNNIDLPFWQPGQNG